MIIPKSTFSVKRDKPDWRDLYYNFARQEEPRKIVDLRQWASPVEDQLHLGSCVGQAVVGAYELMINQLQPNRFVDLSRLFVYYNARLLENMVSEDVGAYVRDGIKAVNKWGVCSESIWPYLVERFAHVPSIESYEDAQQRVIKKYYRISKLKDIVDSLNANRPVVISMNVYDSFYDLSYPGNHVLAIPGSNEELIGGHAVTLVGYNLYKEIFLARNSFGEEWGDRGYFWLPFEYATSDVMDSWAFDIFLK